VQTENQSSGPQLAVGDAAPNAELNRTTGARVTLAELYRQRPTVLVFLRHFG
jgi:peroxiredoxin